MIARAGNDRVPAAAEGSASHGDRLATVADDMVRAWEASWQAYYDGGPKPTMLLCPGTNSPAPDNVDVVNLPQQVVTVTPPPAPAAPAQVITKEITKVQTVAGPTRYVKVAGKTAKSTSRKASCMRKAKAKKSAKARHRAKAKCRRR
jgi:hypothetical protein